MAVTREVTANLSNDASSPNNQSIDCTGVDTLVALVEDPVNTEGNTTGATYNSVAMTEMGRVNRGGTNRQLIIYGLHNPASGSNTLSVTRSSDSVGRFLVGAYGWAGTDTDASLTGHDESVSSASSSGATLTFGNAVGDVCMMISVSSSGGQAAGSGSTLTDSFDIISVYVSNPSPTTSENHSMTMTQTTGQLGLVGVYLTASEGGGGGQNSSFLKFM